MSLKYEPASEPLHISNNSRLVRRRNENVLEVVQKEEYGDLAITPTENTSLYA